MKNLPLTVAAAVAICSVASAAVAHHSFAMFDNTKKIDIKGTVKELQWTNPHVWLQMVTTENGQQKVNVAIPLAIARVGKMKLASSGLVRGRLSKFGIDLDELLRSIDYPGKFVDIADDEDRVEIFVE